MGENTVGGDGSVSDFEIIIIYLPTPHETIDGKI